MRGQHRYERTRSLVQATTVPIDWYPSSVNAGRTIKVGLVLLSQALIAVIGSNQGVPALMRAGRGIYVRPVESRFGTRPPVASKVVEAIAAQWGESVALHGAAAANELGLTTQVPVREVYLTSGRRPAPQAGCSGR